MGAASARTLGLPPGLGNGAIEKAIFLLIERKAVGNDIGCGLGLGTGGVHAFFPDLDNDKAYC